MIASQIHLAAHDWQPNAFGGQWFSVYRVLYPFSGTHDLHWATQKQAQSFEHFFEISHPLANISLCFSTISPVKCFLSCSRIQTQQHATSWRSACCSSLSWLSFWQREATGSVGLMWLLFPNDIHWVKIKTCPWFCLKHPLKLCDWNPWLSNQTWGKQPRRKSQQNHGNINLCKLGSLMARVK